LNLATNAFTDAANDPLALNGSFENVQGSSFADSITGGASNNILVGGGGLDLLDGAAGDDVVQASVTQTVYLDFDSATGYGEHSYSIAERNAIQARLEAVYGAPFSFAYTQNAPALGKYTTLLINAGDSDLLVGGRADEVDWRNVSQG